MPNVSLTLAAGWPDKKKKEVVEGIVKLLERKGFPSETINVSVYETPMEHMVIAGKVIRKKDKIFKIVSGELAV